MLSPVQRPFALPGLPNLRTSDAYFISMIGCFAVKACCFFWFAAFALICFCAACLCTAFGDLSPIFSLPFGCWFTEPQHVYCSESDSRTVSSIADVVKPQMDDLPTGRRTVSVAWWAATTDFGRRHGHNIKTPMQICRARLS